MSEASRTIEIAFPPEAVFDVVAEVESYPQFLGHLGMTAIRVLDRGERSLTAEHEVKKMGKAVRYTLRYELDRPRRIGWSLVSGQMMSHNTGSWRFEDLGGRTRATYSVEIKFGLLVPKALVNMMVSKELPDMLEAFKRRVESKQAG